MFTFSQSEIICTYVVCYYLKMCRSETKLNQIEFNVYIHISQCLLCIIYIYVYTRALGDIRVCA